MLAVLCLIISMVLGVAGQLFIKRGLTLLGNINFASGIVSSYARIFFSPFVIIGISVYFLGVFFWLYALSKVDLSFAYPFVSLSYILVVFSSWWLLGESISLVRWTGVLVICLGVFLISRS